MVGGWDYKVLSRWVALGFVGGLDRVDVSSHVAVDASIFSDEEYVVFGNLHVSFPLNRALKVLFKAFNIKKVKYKIKIDKYDKHKELKYEGFDRFLSLPLHWKLDSIASCVWNLIGSVSSFDGLVSRCNVDRSLVLVALSRLSYSSARSFFDALKRGVSPDFYKMLNSKKYTIDQLSKVLNKVDADTVLNILDLLPLDLSRYIHSKLRRSLGRRIYGVVLERLNSSNAAMFFLVLLNDRSERSRQTLAKIYEHGLDGDLKLVGDYIFRGAKLDGEVLVSLFEKYPQLAYWLKRGDIVHFILLHRTHMLLEENPDFSKITLAYGGPATTQTLEWLQKKMKRGELSRKQFKKIIESQIYPLDPKYITQQLKKG